MCVVRDVYNFPNWSENRGIDLVVVYSLIYYIYLGSSCGPLFDPWLLAMPLSLDAFSMWNIINGGALMFYFSGWPSVKLHVWWRMTLLHIQWLSPFLLLLWLCWLISRPLLVENQQFQPPDVIGLINNKPIPTTVPPINGTYWAQTTTLTPLGCPLCLQANDSGMTHLQFSAQQSKPDLPVLLLLVNKIRSLPDRRAKSYGVSPKWIDFIVCGS